LLQIITAIYGFLVGELTFPTGDHYNLVLNVFPSFLGRCYRYFPCQNYQSSQQKSAGLLGGSQLASGKWLEHSLWMHLN
jgi:hypothetical protein